MATSIETSSPSLRMRRSTMLRAPRAGRRGGIRARAGSGRPGAAASAIPMPPDGRCISLLKILLTNFCVYDCAYCINRRSSNVQRARFSVEEVVRLTLDFYKRNYIEGLFLSSGIIRNPDYTMEELVRVARTLREDHHFRGYIHLKTIPDASQELVEEAGRYADRISINVELPTDAGLNDLAPEKRSQSIRRAMAGMRLRIDEARAEKKRHRFAPAGQSTQMIVGADGADDRTILAASASSLLLICGCAGSTTRRSAPYRMPRPNCRSKHRLCGGNTAYIRQTGSFASMVLRSKSFSWSMVAKCSILRSTRNLRGPCSTGRCSRLILTEAAVSSFCACLVWECAA